jgi:hypothetical protein
MVFDIFYDGGDRVCGTVIPDSYSGVCSIRVSARGRELGVFPTDELNQGVRDVGAHETGLVNFTLTEQSLPGLSAFNDLEIRDADTNLLFYRRLQPGMLTQKYLRLETHLLPLWRLDEAVKPRFQQYYRGVETLGLNCTRQIFHLSQDSIYASGRILIKNFMFCVDNGFKFLVMLHDPHEELAERLLVLNLIEKAGLNSLGEREVMNLRGAIEYAVSLPIKGEKPLKESEKALKRALREMPADVARTLANPIVRQFSTSTLDDQPAQGGVAWALDVLAQSAVVGLRSDPEQFANAVGELLGLDPMNLPIASRLSRVIEFAEMLRRWGYCDIILEKDLELYSLVLEAHQKSGVLRRADEGAESDSLKDANMLHEPQRIGNRGP